MSQSRLAAAAGVTQSVISELEAARSDPGTEVVARLAVALGGRLGYWIDPGTGPLVRDHIQAAMIDRLLKAPNERWRRFIEVSVYRPVRGVIDAVLHEAAERIVVALEFQSELRRVEQQLRWAGAKADALEAGGASEKLTRTLRLAESPREPRSAVHRLLVLRSCTATHQVVATYASVFEAAYPAPHQAIRESLLGTAPWPGSGILWMDVKKGVAAVREDVPRGIVVGRGGRPVSAIG